MLICGLQFLQQSSFSYCAENAPLPILRTNLSQKVTFMDEADDSNIIETIWHQNEKVKINLQTFLLHFQFFMRVISSELLQIHMLIIAKYAFSHRRRYSSIFCVALNTQWHLLARALGSTWSGVILEWHQYWGKTRKNLFDFGETA